MIRSQFGIRPNWRTGRYAALRNASGRWERLTGYKHSLSLNKAFAARPDVSLLIHGDESYFA